MDVIATDEESGQQYFVLQPVAVEENVPVRMRQLRSLFQPQAIPGGESLPALVSPNQDVWMRQLSSLSHPQVIPGGESLPALESPNQDVWMRQLSSLSHPQVIPGEESLPALERIDSTTEQPGPETEGEKTEHNNILLYLLTKKDELKPGISSSRACGNDTLFRSIGNPPIRKDELQAGTSVPKTGETNKEEEKRPEPIAIKSIGRERGRNKNNGNKKGNNKRVTLGAMKPKKTEVVNMHNVLQPTTMESTGDEKEQSKIQPLAMESTGNEKEQSKNNGNTNENDKEMITTVMRKLETIIHHPVMKSTGKKNLKRSRNDGHEKKKNEKITKKIESLKVKVAIMKAVIQQIKSESMEE